MTWSPQQSQALACVRKWLKSGRNSPQIFRLFGFAGTGKTTLAREVEAMAVGTVLYATFTGKAALVLRSKGCRDATTIHSLIYKVVEDGSGEHEFILNRASSLASAALLVVDEVSMVGDELARDLLSFGVKVLALGDPFQLPPVRDTGFFTSGKPDFMLTEIHRQAADNPIIRMSMDIRAGGRLQVGDYGSSRVIPRAKLGQRAVMESDQLLCGINRSRRAFNQKLRDLNGMFGEHPSPGDRLVCLRNNREKGLLNGSLWIAKSASVHDGIVDMVVSSDDPCSADDEASVSVPLEFFAGREDSLDRIKRRRNDEFDYGYALTVHKSQGSQWPKVVLFDESAAFRDDAARWLYTGVTRAADSIVVVK